MQYKCTAYYNTGFDGVNIPDSPKMLDMKDDQGNYIFSRIDLPVLDIRQSRHISSLRVRATWQQVRDIDYIHIRSNAENFPDFGSEYDIYSGAAPYVDYAHPVEGQYFGRVDEWFLCVSQPGAYMDSEDVAVIPVYPDWATSIGGVRNLLITGGITRRIKTTEAVEGVDFFTTPDPFTAPTTPMSISTHPTLMEGYQAYTLIESTLNLEAMASSTTPVPISSPTWFITEDTVISGSGGVITVTGPQTNRGTALFFADNGTVKDGVAKLRELGLESAIISQVSYPRVYCDLLDATGTPVSSGSIPIRFIRGRTIDRVIPTTSIAPISAPLPSTDPRVANANRRAMYGDYLSIGMITSTGDVYTVEPEEVELLGSDSDALKVVMVADPRPDGRPYYIIPTKTNPDSMPYNFLKFSNALPGSRWKQLPLIWYDKSGSYLDRQYFKAQRKTADLGYSYDIASQRLGLKSISASSAVSSAQIDLEEARLNTQYNQGVVGRISSFLGGLAESAVAGFAASAATGAATGAAAGSAAGPVGTVSGAGLGAAVAGVGTAVAGVGTYLSQRNATQNLNLAERGIANSRAALAQQTAIQGEQAQLGLARTRAAYEQARLNDLMQFDLSQSIVAPEIQFAFNTEYLRDYIGNGVLVYQYRYSVYDFLRISKLLNCYGIRHSRPIKKEDFWGGDTSDAPGGRDRNYYFSYVEADGLTIGGLPGWLATEVSAQLSGGVRIWHHLHRVASGETPSASIYIGKSLLSTQYLFPGSPWYYEDANQNRVSGEVNYTF